MRRSVSGLIFKFLCIYSSLTCRISANNNNNLVKYGKIGAIVFVHPLLGTYLVSIFNYYFIPKYIVSISTIIPNLLLYKWRKMFFQVLTNWFKLSCSAHDHCWSNISSSTVVWLTLLMVLASLRINWKYKHIENMPCSLNQWMVLNLLCSLYCIKTSWTVSGLYILLFEKLSEQHWKEFHFINSKL